MLKKIKRRLNSQLTIKTGKIKRKLVVQTYFLFIKEKASAPFSTRYLYCATEGKPASRMIASIKVFLVKVTGIDVQDRVNCEIIA